MGLWPSQEAFPDCLLHPQSTLVQVPVTPMFAPLAICMSASPLDGKPCEAGLCLVHHCTPATQHKAPSSTAYEAPNMEWEHSNTRLDPGLQMAQADTLPPPKPRRLQLNHSDLRTT